MNDLEKIIISKLSREPEKKKRYNFTLLPSVKDGFAKWCKEKGYSESAAIEALLIGMLPKEFLKDYKVE